jgi:hypothetical protein
MAYAFDAPKIDDVALPLANALPVISYAAHFMLAGFDETLYPEYIDGEFGVTEMATLLCLGVAMAFAVPALRMAYRAGAYLLSAWVAVFLVGATYFLGEEASWGQHIIGWQTPEGWRSLNYQQETNLHNSEGFLGDILDKIPRAGLTFCALVFGFVLPVWRSMRSVELSPGELWYWVLPTTACAAAGLFAALGSLPGKIDGLPPQFEFDYGEIKELLLSQFLMIYAMSLAHRLRQVGPG